VNFDKVRIFVGTDGRAMRRAEIALEYTVKKHCSVPYEIDWMDESRGQPNWTGWNNKKWYTPFTNFRFGIPEASGFQGRSIYMDVDQLFLEDPLKLLSLPIPEDKGWLALGSGRSDVMVYDNAKFKGDWWPPLSSLKVTPKGIGIHLSRMKHLWAPLPLKWCCNDGGIPSKQGNKFDTGPYKEGETCLLHYTDMNLQPWRPYPKKFKYPRHPHQEAARIWWEMYALGLEDKMNEDS